MTAWTFTGVALFRTGDPVFLAPVNWPKRLWACPPQMVPLPMRVQRRRVRGYKLPADTICCTRPGPASNPYSPGCGLGFGGFDADMRPVHWALETNADAVRHYREHIRLMQRDRPADFAVLVKPLRGRNLACWCKLCPEHAAGRPLGIVCDACDPCHVDVLLPIANG